MPLAQAIAMLFGLVLLSPLAARRPQLASSGTPRPGVAAMSLIGLRPWWSGLPLSVLRKRLEFRWETLSSR